MASSRKHFQSVLSTAVLMACTAQLSLSHAADTGSVVVGGQVSASTCNIVISDVGATGVQGTKIINLGTVLPGAVQVVTSATSATAVGAVFSVKSTSSNSTDCNLGTNGKWDLALNLTQTQIGYISGTKGVLLNGVASDKGGTDAVVLLKGGVGSTLAQATNRLALDGDQSYDGPLMSGAANAREITATASQSIVLSAQFVRSNEAADPTPGIYSQTIPLLAVYK
jgi:type 1 fimbria pilin